MATINSTSGGGGNDTQQTTQPTSAKNKETTHTPATDSVPNRRILGDPKAALKTSAPEKPATADQQQLTADDMRTAVAEIQEAIDLSASEPLMVAFRPDDTSLSFIIEIRNTNDELIWQFPSEKVLNLRSKLDELSGMVIDQVT